MTMKRIVLCLIATILILCTPQFSKGGTQAVSPDESDRLLKEILSKGLDMYHKYKGVEYLRTEVISEYEPKTNKLQRASEITVTRTDYFYEKPVGEVKTYKKDGKEMKPSKFNYMVFMPTFPMFDERGRENYDLRITDKKIFNGRECYLVQVTPRKETSRHFKGVLYYTVKNLELVYFEGTLAKLDFPLKDFKIEFNTVMFNGIPVFSNGKVYLKIKIPIIYPETQIISNITVLENKLIPL
jgi:hypothetical protein